MNNPKALPERIAAPRSSRLAKSMLGVPEVGILLSLLGFTFLFWLLSHALLSRENLGSMLRAMAFVGVISVGMTLLMIAGEIDLSVGSVAGLCGVVAAHLMTSGNWSVGAAICAGLAAGGACGLINGLIAVKLGIPAFIATLGMLYIARGATYLISQGQPIYPLPDSIRDFGASAVWGTSWSFLIFIALVAAGDFVMRRMVFGKMIQATGGNKQAARLAGVNTDGVKITCFVLTGVLAGLAGILVTASFNTGRSETGTGWELEAIAAVVIGGVSLFGGVGTVTGTLLGLSIMAVVRSGLVLSSVNTHWQTVAVGVIMIVAVGVDLLRRKTRA